MTDRPMRYPELSSTEHLKASGREFLGHRVYATEKRDGANIHLWGEVLDYPEGVSPPMEPNTYILHHEDLAFRGDTTDKTILLKVHVSSRNMDEASADFQAAVRKHPDFQKYVHMLAENPNFNIFVEYVPAGRGPTRLEPPHKKANLVLFDIATMDTLSFDSTEGFEKTYKFINYTMLYQLAKHHKVPIVELLGDGRFPTLDEFKSWMGEMLKWCKRHRREGVVIKCFDTEPQVYSKEKIDMPKRPKFSKTVEGGVVLPPLPDSEVNGALNKLFADFGYEFLRDKTKAMPKFAEYVGVECRKHLCTSPSAPLYQYYMTFLTNLDTMHKEQAHIE